LFAVLLNDSGTDGSSGGVDGRLMEHHDKTPVIRAVYGV
jgi:hypothetical protein